MRLGIVAVGIVIGGMALTRAEAETLFVQGEWRRDEGWGVVSFGRRAPVPLEVRWRRRSAGVEVTVRADHIPLGRMDVSSQMEIDWAPAEGGLEGRLVTRYNLIDYRPAPEVSGRFRRLRDTLQMEFAGPGWTIDGRLGLRPPYDVDLRADVHDMASADLLRFSPADCGTACAGTVTGTVRLSGRIDRLFIDASLRVEGGTEAGFRQGVFNLRGSYPHVELYDSRLVGPEGDPIEVSGRLRLDRMKTWQDQLEGLVMEPVTHEEENSSEWTIKQLDSGDRGVIELKYRQRREHDVRTLSDEARDMLGVERRVDF